MPQTQFKATGLSDSIADKIQETAMAVAGVKWVNVNPDNIVLTHEEGFDYSLFLDAVKSVDANVNLTQA